MKNKGLLEDIYKIPYFIYMIRPFAKENGMREYHQMMDFENFVLNEYFKKESKFKRMFFQHDGDFISILKYILNDYRTRW